MSSGAETSAPAAPAQSPGGATARLILFGILRTLLPVLLALLVGAVVLLLLGADPLAYYGYVLKRGLLTWSGLQETIIRMPPNDETASTISSAPCFRTTAPISRTGLMMPVGVS